jgi:glycosyltransferase involved in cell wall biosynthesis
MHRHKDKKLPVSFIMTVYNGERTVRQAIESICQQTVSNFELVIVDDGSEDSTPEIVSEALSDPRISMIARSRIGRAKALNVAWQHAKGQYIANLDADDMAKPDRLEKQLAFIQTHSEVGLVGTAVQILDETTGNNRVERNPLDDAELKRQLVRRNPFVHSSVMLPRQVLEAVGGYNEKFRKCIDYELWVRIARSYSIANMPDVLTIKRIHPEAYFRHELSERDKHIAHLKIRWQAWWAFSRSASDLLYIFRSPLAWWWQNFLPVAPQRHFRRVERFDDGT